MSFWISDDGFLLRDTSADCVVESLKLANIIGDWQGAGKREIFSDGDNSEICRTTYKVGVFWESSNEVVNDVAKDLCVARV